MSLTVLVLVLLAVTLVVNLRRRSSSGSAPRRCRVATATFKQAILGLTHRICAVPLLLLAFRMVVGMGESLPGNPRRCLRWAR